MSRGRKASTKLPVIITEAVYSRAAIAAEMEGMTLSEYTEQALLAVIPGTLLRNAKTRYRIACQEAELAGQPLPFWPDYRRTVSQAVPEAHPDRGEAQRSRPGAEGPAHTGQGSARPVDLGGRRPGKDTRRVEDPSR